MAKLQQLADLVGGEVSGDAEIEIGQVAPIDKAQAGDITFVANPKYLPQLKSCQASAVILSPGIDVSGQNLLICANPYLAFAKILTFLQVSPRPVKGIMPGALVSESAVVDPAATIYPGCVIGERVTIGSGTTLYPGVAVYADVTIGEDCVVHANVVIREGCHLHDRVILQPAAVIGSDGFGFAPDGAKYYKIPQVGVVVLEDDVEIGANTSIDRAALGVTLIRRGTKIDNLVQIGHNVEVGEDCILVSQSGIAGSSKVGNHCTFGGQAAIAGHLTIGDNVMIGGRGGATGNVAPNQILSGLPLMPHKKWLRATMTLPKLPEMRKDMQQMQKRLDELEALLKEK
ncbi:UDP-3-O-[3-hydroxymyristoyl] glucosamine N-acyltransferase [Desulfuromusa kysingii]|uniref:UDP-3-O-acylglucosamine N-acyltransferase n=1 Tax=Desulfuromusa kysingii TaxID=37625 RepID=A0A1H3YH26_9BACT|nr:UDP-3-O-(3-hydroxymyristoyl)glucosamine N-acyltransferase [Desulfuromusa kysingii]SEA10162.1 UDP-3-O-[3-hydroxymyristoyl] glucosamine N-acyltransferase [Desulfuromusa kysingii]